MSDQAKVTDFVESQIKSRAKIFKHGFAIDRTLKDRVRVTIVAARFDDTVEEPEIIEPPKVEEQPLVVGKGINAIIPEKPAKVIVPKPNNQIGLFEQEDKFLMGLNDFTKNGVIVDDLLDSPAYKRYGVQLIDIAEVGEENLDKINLMDLYTELSNQKLID